MRVPRRAAAPLLTLAVLLAAAPTAAAGSRPLPQGWVVDRVRFEPLDPAGAPLVAEGVGQYRGALEVRPGLLVLNDVALDDYLKGISEVPTSWPAEAQRAQAVAARTYALHEVFNRTRTPWRDAGAHICATDSCQVYTGVAKERREGSAAWSSAVVDTHGQVLVFQGKPILAKYSSSNGGHTVPGGRPYLRGVPDPDDAASPLHHWRYALPLPTVAAAFAVPGELFDVGRAGDAVIATSRLPDGQQHQQAIGIAEFRDRLNAVVAAPAGLPKAVPSMRYTVSTNGDGVVIDGRGWGHGIGLSQYGALGKARRGMRAADILASYYGGLRPVVVPDAMLPPTVRVAVAFPASRASITAPGRFRVVAGDGAQLAAIALGRWQVVPAGRGKVRVVPPPGYDQPLAVEAVGLEPGLSGPGTPARLRVRLSTPAVLKATVREEDGTPVELAPVVVDSGDQVLTLPPATRPGDVLVSLAADAGPGRALTVPFSYRVPGPDLDDGRLPTFDEFAGGGARQGGTGRGEGRGAWPLVAGVLAFGIGIGVVRRAAARVPS